MKRIDDEEIDAILKVLYRDPVCLSGFYKNPKGGPSVQAFEKALTDYHGVKHAICVSNGTSALHIALMSCDIGPGDEVITTPLTFSATATSILMTGATPIFVDVDPRTYNINPREVKHAITERTKAVLPVHLLGMPCEMDDLLDITWEYHVLEDNAQALGARYYGKLTGTLGDLSTLSFQETKVITSAGEGGAILTGDDELAEKCRYLRNHGQQYGRVDYLCWNFRMTEIQAAFGLVQLRKVDEFNRMQVENAKLLFEALPRDVHPPHIPDYVDPTLYIIGCLAESDFPREQFVENLTEKGVNKNLPGATVGLGYTKTIMDLPLLQPYKRSCPVAEDLIKYFLWFDCHRWKTKEEMEKTIEVIRECIPWQ